MANIQILGKLGKDVEIKNVGGHTVAEFSVAETVGFGDRKKAIWYDCALWGKQAQSGLVDYLNKGREVFICGQLDTFEANNGKTYLKVKIDSISLTSGTKDNQGQKTQQPQQQGGYAQPQQAKPQGGGGHLDEDLPFASIDWRLG